jgi:hypothetical protein
VAPFKVVARWLPICLLLLSATGRGQSVPATARPASSLACAQHFDGQGCENLGASFFAALAMGREQCRERYDSSYETQLDQLQDSASPGCAGGASPDLSVQCRGEGGDPAGRVLRETAGAWVQAGTIDPAFSQRLSWAIDSYRRFAAQPGADARCRQRLVALSAELQRARSGARRCPSIAPGPADVIANRGQPAGAAQVSGSPGSESTTANLPASPPRLNSNTTGPLNSPVNLNVPSVASLTPQQGMGAAARNQPLESVPAAAPLAPPPAPVTNVDNPPSTPPTLFSQITPEPASGPPGCAVDAMVDEIRREKQAYQQKGFFGRLIAHVTGGTPRANADRIMSDSAEASEAFIHLSPREQEAYLKFCPASEDRATDPSRDQLRAQSGDSSPGANGLNGMPGSASFIPGGEGGSGASDWPPQCVLNVMTIHTMMIKQANEGHSWLGRTFARLEGLPSVPANAEEILKDPRAAFAALAPKDKAGLLKICQHQISPSDWEIARATTGGAFQVPDYVKQEAFTPVPTLLKTEGGAGWPPRCALDAMTDELHDLKDQDHAYGRTVTFLRRIASEPTAPRDVDALLKDPQQTFLKLSPDDQTKYMQVCLLEGPSREMGSANGAPGIPGISSDPMIAALPRDFPPSCALDAFTKDISAQVSKDQKRGWVSRGLAHLFGDGPPKGASEMLADPKASFAKLGQPEQIEYLRACLPCPEHPEKPGLITRIRRYFQNMGWFGKTLTVIGTALAGALLWRIRGGFLPTGNTQVARLIAAVPMAIIGGILGGPAGVLAGMLTFVELAVSPPGLNWAKNFAMVGPTGQIAWSSVANMTARGVWQTLLTGAALMSPFMMLSGAAMGPIYLAADRFMQSWSVGAKIGFAGYYTQWAELFTGAWIYGSFAATLLAQNAHHAQVVSCIAGH